MTNPVTPPLYDARDEEVGCPYARCIGKPVTYAADASGIPPDSGIAAKSARTGITTCVSSVTAPNGIGSGRG